MKGEKSAGTAATRPLQLRPNVAAVALIVASSTIVESLAASHVKPSAVQVMIQSDSLADKTHFSVTIGAEVGAEALERGQEEAL